MSLAAIGIAGLWVQYPAPGGRRLTVLDLPEFAVAFGEAVTVAGRSGSGKTTLLNVLAGIVRPTDGAVEVLGHSLPRLSEEGRDRYRLLNVGYVHQQYNLLPGLTALENVMLPATFAPAIRRRDSQASRARDLLRQVGLGDRLDHRPSQLSGGEQQRVAIARALILSPGLLLLDEPTANLDVHTTLEVMGLVRELWHRLGMTVIIASHDELVLRDFGRCVELTQPDQGRVTDVSAGDRMAQSAFQEPA